MSLSPCQGGSAAGVRNVRPGGGQDIQSLGQTWLLEDEIAFLRTLSH